MQSFLHYLSIRQCVYLEPQTIKGVLKNLDQVVFLPAATHFNSLETNESNNAPEGFILCK